MRLRSALHVGPCLSTRLLNAHCPNSSKARHDANDAGVHYITRSTTPHFHCFSDPTLPHQALGSTYQKVLLSDHPPTHP